MKKTWGTRPIATALMLAAAFASVISDTALAEGRPAKELFGGMALPAKAAPSRMASGVSCARPVTSPTAWIDGTEVCE